MRFSLIVATKGRYDEVLELVESLINQSFKDFEVILVDQNETDKLINKLKSLNHQLAITYVKAKPGLSKARNIGLTKSIGDIIAFPDDDCLYPVDTLEKVNFIFEEKTNLDGITGVSVDKNMKLNNGFESKDISLLNKYNVWKKGISYTIFLKKKCFENNLYFNENLGVGSNTIFGSGEETDLLLRIINNKNQIEYHPNIFVKHPSNNLQIEKKDLKKHFDYAVGMGYVLKINNYSFWYKIYHLIRPLLGSLYFLMFKLNLKKSRHSIIILHGRWKGMF